MDTHDTGQTMSPNKEILKRRIIYNLASHLQQTNKQPSSGRNRELWIQIYDEQMKMNGQLYSDEPLIYIQYFIISLCRDSMVSIESNAWYLSYLALIIKKNVYAELVL